MSVEFPEWFDHNFVNVENLMIDMFTKIVPTVESGAWTPDSWIENPEPTPMFSFLRLPGGRVSYDENYDECTIQAVAITDKRHDSVELMSLVRAVLLPIKGDKFTMADGYTAQIHKVEEVGGPHMLTPGQAIDTRAVPANFMVRVGLRSRARYGPIIRAL